jgi:hypothetical protein
MTFTSSDHALPMDHRASEKLFLDFFMAVKDAPIENVNRSLLLNCRNETISGAN